MYNKSIEMRIIGGYLYEQQYPSRIYAAYYQF